MPDFMDVAHIHHYVPTHTYPNTHTNTQVNTYMYADAFVWVF